MASQMVATSTCRTALYSLMALCLGAVAGYAVREFRNSSPAGSPDRVDEQTLLGQPAWTSSPPESSASLQDEVDRLKRSVAELSAKNKALEMQVEASRHVVLVDPAEKQRIARQIARAWVRAVETGDDESFLKMLAQLSEIDQSMAGVFLEEFKAATTMEGRVAALTLVLSAGGDQVAAFIEDSLIRADVSVENRAVILNALAGNSGMFSGLDRVPMTPALCDLAERFASSADPIERSAGAGLLGGVDTQKSRDRLQEIVNSESNTKVLAAAIRALGRNGDKANYDTLKSFQNSRSSAQLGSGSAVGRALVAAISRLERKLNPGSAEEGK